MRSRSLSVQFDSNMPGSNVEVLGADQSVRGRTWIEPGGAQEFERPPGKSFLRFHLPSGRVVTLPAGSERTRIVTLADVQEQRPSDDRPPEQPSRQELRKYLAQPNIADSSRMMATSALTPRVSLGDQAEAWLATRLGGSPISGSVMANGREVAFKCSGYEEPLEFVAATPEGELHVQIPGSAMSVWARADRVEPGLLHFAVRIATRDPNADALTEYMARGDMRSAETMASWVDSAQGMLFEKTENPYAAAAGAYLLLRLQRFDEMHDWAKNLAERFPWLPDGAIIWARQLILQAGASRAAEIRTFLAEAVTRGLPIFREGLALLVESLALLGPDGSVLAQTVNSQLGRGILDSPFTAGLIAPSGPSAQRVQFDIGIASRA